MEAGLAMIIKQRAQAGSIDQMDLVGNVKDADCIMVDNMIDTIKTTCSECQGKMEFLFKNDRITEIQ